MQKEILSGDDDFNLNKFRDSLYLKIQSPNPLRTNSVRKDENSIKQSQKLNHDLQHRKSVPSFDELLKNMNGNIVQSQSNHKRTMTDSSKKISGLQTKIEVFGNNEISQVTRLSQPFISNKPILLPSNTSKRTTFSSSITEKPVFTKHSSSLLDQLSLKELMEIRSKIDNSTQSEIHSLSANYVQELVKLSQIITKQVKHIK